MTRRSSVLAICLTIVACSAVSAAAGALITGKNVKDSSLTGADIKNGSIKKADLAKGLAAAGKTGPAGATGAAGAAGPAGATGAAGTPGTARAYADVIRGTPPTLRAARTKGFSSVTQLSGFEGEYCVQLSAGSTVDPATTPVVATIENSTSASNGTVEVWSGTYGACGTSAFHVRTYDVDGNKSSALSFILLAP